MTLRNLCVLIPAALGAYLVSSCAAGGGGTSCGNGYCEADETSMTCPADCGGGTCGNGVCDVGENATACPSDCSTVTCGNGMCEAVENTVTCQTDCYCPNGSCDIGENANTCPADCGGTACGNGVCDVGEDQASCPQDCTTNPVCGDGVCNGTETATSCPADCDLCGNGTCDPGEETSCPSDCPGSCTDPLCDLYPQCGCTGQKCSLDGNADRACIDAGSTQAGGSCTAETDCARGTLCIGRSASQGQCVSYCDATNQSTCSGSTSYCLELVDGGRILIPGAAYCTTTCLPHQPTLGCGAGMACEIYTHNTTQVDFTDCHGDVGSGLYGDPCDVSAGSTGPFCSVGYGCFNDGVSDSCYQWCVPGSSCAVGTCNTTVFDPPLMLGGNTYGVCIL